MLGVLVALGALPLLPQVDGGLSALTVQELLAINADITNPCYGSGAHEWATVSWVVAPEGGTPVACTLDAPEPLDECLRRAVCTVDFPTSAAPTTVRGTWEGATEPLRPPLEPVDPVVEVAIRAQAPRLADCAQLGILEAQLTVGSEGRVLRATFPFRSATLGAETEACVRGALRGWQLPKTLAAPATFEARFLFAQTPERFAVLGQATGYRVASAPRSARAGGLSRDVILPVIRMVQPNIKACYEVRARSRPNLEGLVSVGFTIGATGAVEEAHAAEVTLPSEGAVACILDVIRGLQFPPPEGGGTVAVKFPYVFSIAKEEQP